MGYVAKVHILYPCRTITILNAFRINNGVHELDEELKSII